MSQENQQQRPIPDMRKEMKSITANQTSSLGEPLIKIDPANLDATARNPSVMHMAVLRTFAVQTSREKVKSVKGVMDSVEQNYQKISIGYQGKAREEYGKFANLAAAGGGPLADNAAIMQPLLSESGSKTAAKTHFWNRNKGKNK